MMCGLANGKGKCKMDWETALDMQEFICIGASALALYEVTKSDWCFMEI